MRFDGVVGDLGSKAGNETRYEISFIGEDLPRLKEFVLERCRLKELEVLTLEESKEKDGKWKVTAKVRSQAGII